MRKYILCLLSVMVLNAQTVKAQGSYSYNERVKKYVEQYYPLAIAEQRTTGIPASVTLGQGILETDAGASELMTLANNHFGIKCTNNWLGETISHDDETDNECFKKYSCAGDSYKDHSEHLKTNPRYKPLFALSPTDYAAWAVCLKKCGYATNPLYAQRLIKIIEDFRLQEYTYSALDTANNYPVIPEVVKMAFPSGDAMQTDAITAANTRPIAEEQAVSGNTNIETPVTDTSGATDMEGNIDSSKIIDINGMRAFYVYKNENLLPYAVKYHVRYARLLEMNDMPDAPAPFNTYLYLEKKLTYGINPNHKVADGETLLMISQSEGVQLKKIMALNQLNPNEEPVAGTILELQKPAIQKPDVKITEQIAHRENAIVPATIGDPTPGSDYITIDRSKDNDIDDTPVAKPVLRKKNADKNNQQEVNKSLKAAHEKAHADSLATLKAELDKEVYADDSKLAGANLQKPAKPYTGEGETTATQQDYYTVHKGETLFSIAAKNNISIEQLQAWNNITANKIESGQKLRVTDPVRSVSYSKNTATALPKATKGRIAKAGKYYVIKRGETLFAIAKKNNITVDQLMQWNDIDADKIQSGQKLRVSE
jgi:LysM repeat protein